MTNLKRRLLSILPMWAKNLVRKCDPRQFLWRNMLYDYFRFRRYSALRNPRRNRSALRALLIMDYHRLEKGLSFERPRPGFGKVVIDRLKSNLVYYVDEYGWDSTASMVRGTLCEYVSFSKREGVSCDDLEEFLAVHLGPEETEAGQSCVAGTFERTKAEIQAGAQIDFEHFVETRHSVRHFTADAVESTVIEEAVRLALRTPSVCNRQSWRVHAFRGEKKMKVLLHQNGNRGFGESIDTLLLVTSDLRTFVSVGERNQAWIDGGMFAMTLVYALHSLGLGTCCLNCSIRADSDRRLRREAKLANSEAIIMMIAVGHLADRFRVACSSRKPLAESLTFHS